MQTVFNQGSQLLSTDSDGPPQGDPLLDDVPCYIEFVITNGASPVFPTAFSDGKYNNIQEDEDLVTLHGSGFANIKLVNSINIRGTNYLGWALPTNPSMVYALGVPLKVVEEKTHVKSETVSALLKRVIYKALWSELEQRILGMRLRIISKDQLDWLHEIIQAEVDTPGELHSLGLIKAAYYRKRQQRNDRKIERILQAKVVDPKEAQRNPKLFVSKTTGLQTVVIKGQKAPEELMRKLFGKSVLYDK